jgi:hypothetical protein
VSEKSISERAKDTLVWIQKQQQKNGLGMVEFGKVPDQGAVRYLLRVGDVFEPQAGMIKSTVELEAEELEGEYPDHAPWVWRTPKPKRKGDVPEPYEFLAYPEWSVLPSAVAEGLRGMGFSGAPFLFEGYSYRKMAGGALRRKMIGKHSKAELLAELKLTCKSEEEYAKLESKIEGAIKEYGGKRKEVSKVECDVNIVFYPKDGSFSLKKEDEN